MTTVAADQEPAQVTWFGQAPKRWTVKQVGYVVRLRSGESITSDDIEVDGAFPVFGGNGFRGFTSRWTHDGDFVMIGRQGALCGNVNVGRGRFFASEHAIVATPISPVATGWLSAVFEAMELRQYSVAAAQPGLSVETISHLLLPTPPLDEQRQIAEYLDRETGKIEELIAKQEQLVTTLTERRHSFIDKLVAKQTRGEGEGLTRVKNLYAVIDQRTGNPDLPLLSVSIHYGVRVRGEMTEDAPKSSDLSGYKVVRPNDIVINRMRAFQGALGCSPTAGVVSPDYMVLRPKSSVDPNWLAMVFRSNGFVGEMTSRLRGIGSTESGMIRTPRINVDDLGGIQIRVPALSEQIDLVETVTADVELNSAISDTATRMVELLRERRAALINAAITGKIDVRGL